MNDLEELEAYLSQGSYAKVAKQFKIQNSTAQSRIRRQALTVMAATHYLKHDLGWEEQYTYLMWRVLEHKELFIKLIDEYKQLSRSSASKTPPGLLASEDRPLTSLTVAEFEKLLETFTQRLLKVMERTLKE